VAEELAFARKPSALILATPIYYENVSGQMALS